MRCGVARESLRLGAPRTLAQETAMRHIRSQAAEFAQQPFETVAIASLADAVATSSVDYSGRPMMRAPPCALAELAPGLPKKKHTATLSVIAFVDDEAARWLADPMPGLKAEADFPDPPHDGAGQRRLAVRVGALAMHLVDLGIFTVLPAEELVHVRGEPIPNMVPGNAPIEPLVGEAATLAGSTSWVLLHIPEGTLLLWSGDDQKGSFFVRRGPRAWHRYTAAGRPLAGSLSGRQEPKVHLASAVIAMGWSLAAPVHQRIHVRLRRLPPPLGAGLPPQAERRKDAPRRVAAAAQEGDSARWQVYIDDIDAREIVEEVRARRLIGSLAKMQIRARASYDRAGVAYSAEKAHCRHLRVERMGADVDGESGRPAAPLAKSLEAIALCLASFRLEAVPRRLAMTILGRFVKLCEFQRPLVSLLSEVCGLTSQRGNARFSAAMLEELLAATMPMAATSLRAKIEGMATVSDASEFGGGWRASAGLRAEPEASLSSAPTLDEQMHLGARLLQLAAVLLVGLFDGIGGLAAAFSRLPARATGCVTAETDAEARRVVRLRWPGAIDWGDATRAAAAVVNELRDAYCDEVDLCAAAAGSPCQDLARLKASGAGLRGAMSGLFYEVPRLLEPIRAAFGHKLKWLHWMSWEPHVAAPLTGVARDGFCEVDVRAPRGPLCELAWQDEGARWLGAPGLFPTLVRSRPLDAQEVVHFGWRRPSRDAIGRHESEPGLPDTLASRRLVLHYLARAEKGGTDVRLDCGLLYRPRGWPRSSLDPFARRWRAVLSTARPAAKSANINVRELQAAAAALRWRARKTRRHCSRWPHLVDSQVVAAIVTKGRGSSRRLQPALARWAAAAVAADMYPVVGYVASEDISADEPSRRLRRGLRLRAGALRAQSLVLLRVGAATRHRHSPAVGRLLEHYGVAGDGVEALGQEGQDADALVSGYLEVLWASGAGIAAPNNAAAGSVDVACLLMVAFEGLLRGGDVAFRGQCAAHRIAASKGSAGRDAAEAVVIRAPITFQLLRLVTHDLDDGDRPSARSPHQLRAALAALVEGLGLQCPFSWHSCGASECSPQTKSMELTMVRGRWASSLTARIYVEDALTDLALVQRGDAQATLIRQGLQSLRVLSELRACPLPETPHGQGSVGLWDATAPLWGSWAIAGRRGGPSLSAWPSCFGVGTGTLRSQVSAESWTGRRRPHRASAADLLKLRGPRGFRAEARRARMDPAGLLLREATRGFAAGAAAWGAAWGAQCPSCPACPSCTCSCEPRLARPGGSVSEVQRPEPLGASLAWLVSLAVVAAAGCAFGRWSSAAQSPAPALPSAAAGLAPAAQEAPASAAQLAAAQEMAMAAVHPVAALGLQEGDFILVEYAGYPNVFHERLVVLAPDGSSLTCTLTPDDDSYEEDLFSAAEVRRWLPCDGGRMGAYPPAAAGMHVHGFRGVPSPVRVAQVLAAAAARLGIQLGAGDAVTPNLIGGGGGARPRPGAVGAAAAAGGLVAAPAAGGGMPPAGVLVAGPPAAAAPAGGAPAVAAGVAGLAAVLGAAPAAPAAGAPVAVGPPPPLVAAPAAAPIAAAAAAGGGALAAPALADARIQPVTYDLQGQRHADFRTAVMGMSEGAFPDWPVRGPRTALWVLKFMEAHGGTPTGRHSRWLSETRLQGHEPGVDEHERACRTLERMVIYDQLNVANLASGEMLARTVQLQEERYRDRVAPAVDSGSLDAHVLLGTDQLRGNVCVAPLLQDHIKDELTKMNAYRKEQRKAREERDLARKNKKGTKGDKGSGKDDNPHAVLNQTRASGISSPCRTWAAGTRVPVLGAAAVDAIGFLMTLSGQRASLAHIQSAFACLKPIVEDEGFPEGALSDILSGSPLYASGGPRRPYSRDLISWPDAGDDPVPLTRVVAGPDAQWLRDWSTKMLRGREEADALLQQVCPRGPYVDPHLAFSPATFADFLAEMLQRKMICFEAEDPSIKPIGVFCVAKKSNRLRLIFDTRTANAYFTDPPATALPSAAAFAGLEAPGGRVVVAAGDIDNAFYRMLMPEGLCRYFRLPPIDRLCESEGREVSVDHSQLNFVSASPGTLDPYEIPEDPDTELHSEDPLILDLGKKLKEFDEARGRRAALAGRLMAERPPLGRLSALETLAVRSSTEEQYRRVLTEFTAFCSANHLDWKDFDQLDSVATRFLNRQFELGAPASQGSLLLASLAHFLPGLQGSWKAQLPRATRSSVAWARRVPSMTRVPLPYFAAAALAGLLAISGRRRMALWILLSFSCYLRPFEAQGLRGGSLVRPAAQAAASAASWVLLLHPTSGGRPGKTGLYNESVVIDLDRHLWPLPAGLRGAVGLDQSLWDFTLPALRERFREFADLLQLQALNPTLYALRRGGASWDLLEGRRTLEQTQRHGRWASPGSMKRYAKEAYLQDAMTKVPDWVFGFGRFVHANLLEIVELGPALPQRPRLWQQLPAPVQALIAAALP
ncbi:unnamed protein product [Prorocentrum cordatum]|uniref:Calmodulin n=1 Tax=Prorocentrum cordatum TaxID=2364126 RepID=A0ABN9U1P3_9DINO|nr:unnamed protein product [Polarella glacialis]